MRAIPLKVNEKTPAEKRWRERLYPLEELSDWRGNIGLPTGEPNNIIAVDFDAKEPARQFFREHRDIIRTITVTRRGVHFWFSGSGPSTRFEHGDIQADGKLVVLPASRIDDFEYRFAEGHEPQELCPFPRELFIPKSQPIAAAVSEVRNALAYIYGIRAVAGQKGHNATFKAACKLRDAGLSEAEALETMIIWNETNAEPPWTLRELTHKVTDAYAKGAK